MLRKFMQWLRSIGIFKRQEPEIKINTDTDVAVQVSSGLLELFTRAAHHAKSGDLVRRQEVVNELLVRFSDELEITPSTSDRSAIYIRPRRSRFSALLVVKLNDLDQELKTVTLARMLQRPVPSSDKTSQAQKLPKARLSH